jgi:hypothetical protein
MSSSTGEPWNSVEGKPEAERTLSALCIRNMADLHNNHSDRACGRVIEMDLRTASEPLRVHVTGDLGNILRAITIQHARCLTTICYVHWKWITQEQRVSVSCTANKSADIFLDISLNTTVCPEGIHSHELCTSLP